MPADQATALARATGGRLTRAGDTLLQLQRAHGNRHVQQVVQAARAAGGTNRTGLPDGLKSAMEEASGLDLSGIRVHYGSSRPAQLGALAYTQGRDIHVAPCQQRHLPHEVWHAVQQMSGRVRPTSTDAGLPLNDDPALEREADLAAHTATRAAHLAPPHLAPTPTPSRPSGPSAPVQLKRAHVNKRLLDWHKGKGLIGDDDKERVFQIFSQWRVHTRKADSFKGREGAGEHRTFAERAITKKVIEALNDATDISIGIRRELIENCWNKEQADHLKVVLQVPAVAPTTTMTRKRKRASSWVPMSPLAEHAQPLTEPPEEQVTLYSTSSGKTELVRKATYVEDVVFAIRAFQKQSLEIPKNLRLVYGLGLFERRSRPDIIFTLLRQVEGMVERVGNVAPWNAILRDLPAAYWQNPRLLFGELQAALRGERAPSGDVIDLMAGAMISDVKHGIRTWISVLSELYPLLKAVANYEPAELQKLFVHWYVYIAQRQQAERHPVLSYRSEPNRVQTIEWEMPTLIPRRGGFDFPQAGDRPRLYLERLGPYLLEGGVRTPQDIVKLWNLALVSKAWYNALAGMLREAHKAIDEAEQ